MIFSGILLGILVLSSIAYCVIEYRQSKKTTENEKLLAELALIVQKHERILGLVKDKPVSPLKQIARRELRGVK
jgi:hypothetical protein